MSVDIEQARKDFVCAECGEHLSIYMTANREKYIACHRHHFNGHTGFMKPVYQSLGEIIRGLYVQHQIIGQQGL